MKATEFDKRFDAGEDVSDVVDWGSARRINQEPRRVNVSMAMLRSPLVANWKSPPFADVQLVLSRVPPFALACRMR